MGYCFLGISWHLCMAVLFLSKQGEREGKREREGRRRTKDQQELCVHTCSYEGFCILKQYVRTYRDASCRIVEGSLCTSAWDPDSMS